MLDELFKFLIDNSVRLMITVGMIIIMLSTKNHFPKNVRKYIQLTFGTIFVYSLVAAYDRYVGVIPHADYPLVVCRRIASFVSYSLRPLLIAFSILIVCEMTKRKKIYFFIPIIVNSLFHMTSFWCKLVYYIDDDNVFDRDPLGFMSFVVIGLYLAFLIYLFVKTMIKGKTFEGTILIFMIVCSVTAGVIDAVSDKSTDNMGDILCVSVMFYYLYLNVEYARKYELELIRSQKNELVLSQVKPHFMYNVLTSIYYLCDHDPKKAKKAVNDFSLYLRHNLDTSRGEQIVEFKNELSYVQYYLSLEKVRFDAELEYDFDLETTDFSIPKFTLQPIVENAVKHGVSQKLGGGHVHIYTKDEGNRIKVGVIDDGVGFDKNQKPDDSRSHVGIKNISYRLMEFLGEELHIESKVGEGTHSYFYVPKK